MFTPLPLPGSFSPSGRDGREGYAMQNNLSDKQSNFLLYTGNDGKVNIEVFLKDETVWLTQKAMAELF